MNETHPVQANDCRTISEREAERALREHIRVYAPETPEGGLGRVAAIQPLSIGGRLTPAVSIRFESGYARSCEGGLLFYLAESCNGS
jgi:hypothetical protein